jgi:hypothetical protein
MRRGRRSEARFAIGSKHVGSSYERPFERPSRRPSCSGGFCVSAPSSSLPFCRQPFIGHYVPPFSPCNSQSWHTPLAHDVIKHDGALAAGSAGHASHISPSSWTVLETLFAIVESRRLRPIRRSAARAYGTLWDRLTWWAPCSRARRERDWSLSHRRLFGRCR